MMIVMMMMAKLCLREGAESGDGAAKFALEDPAMQLTSVHDDDDNRYDDDDDDDNVYNNNCDQWQSFLLKILPAT